MREVVVALDLETTGFDTSKDRIIEIGAVKFDANGVVDEWQSLVNPALPIPSYITQLTGISNRDVADADSIQRVLPRLRDFIGDQLIVGHNLRFDLGFLSANGLRLGNPTMDTYAIASVMLPQASRYNLSALAHLLNISVVDAHRALNDCRVTAEITLELWRRSAHLPDDTLAEIVRAGRHIDWEGRLFFEAALKEREVEVPATEPSRDFLEMESVSGDDAPSVTLKPSRTIEQLDINQAAALLEQGGALSKTLNGYESRPEQVSMLKMVAEALNKGKHVMIEAPTGVGKSLAYLAPSALFAIRNDDRVVISTNTINLQDQLINKDIPLLQETLGLSFRAAILKGRGNYLCPRRLTALRRRGPTSAEEMLMLARILVWMTYDQTGDRGELPLRGQVESAIWARLSAEDEGCKTERCASQMAGICPFYRARRAAEAAHLLIVNHSLLISDVASEGKALPEYKYLIIDEAHHLEDATTSGLTFRTTRDVIAKQMADLGGPNSGLLGELLRRTNGSIPSGHYATLSEFVAVVVQASGYMTSHVELFFGSLNRFLLGQTRAQPNDYSQFVRVVPSMRRMSGWDDVATHWDNLSQFTSSIADAMNRLASGLRELSEYEIDEYEDLVAGVDAAARHLTELHGRLNAFVTAPDSNTIYWAEIQPSFDNLSVNAAPLDVGPLVKQCLWDTKDTVVMTSATLQTRGSFGYIQNRLDADHVSVATIPSPFDYEASALLYLVDDAPEPAEVGAYQKAVEQGLLKLCVATQGRTLALFTSRAQLRDTASAIGDALLSEGITLYDQANGSSRAQLLDGFIRREKAVLMGTRSFWEGVDVPGADLSVLVIARLPFSVPTDPVFAARSEQFQDPFLEYSIPDAILRFRQGFGRLIRRKSDKGVVAIFDRRVISKRYGQMFLESLPRCTVKKGAMADLPGAAARWLESG